MYAARWANDFRGDRTWDRPEWHYLNVPIALDEVPGRPPAALNVLTARSAWARPVPPSARACRSDGGSV
jgi:hypothetical protein